MCWFLKSQFQNHLIVKCQIIKSVCSKIDLLPIYFIPLTLESFEVLLSLIKFLKDQGKFIIMKFYLRKKKNSNVLFFA